MGAFTPCECVSGVARALVAAEGLQRSVHGHQELMLYVSLFSLFTALLEDAHIFTGKCFCKFIYRK